MVIVPYLKSHAWNLQIVKEHGICHAGLPDQFNQSTRRFAIIVWVLIAYRQRLAATPNGAYVHLQSIAMTDVVWWLNSMREAYVSGEGLMLVGWRLPVRPADCGVPEEVAYVMARALTAIFRVTFPLSGDRCDALPPSGADSEHRVLPLPARGLAMRLKAFYRGMPPRRCLVSAHSPEIVMQVFTDPGFPWHLKGQVALLSAPSAECPEIATDVLLALADDEWATEAEALRGSCVEGIVRPGVDGDVIGALSLTADFQDSFVRCWSVKPRPLDWAGCCYLRRNSWKHWLGIDVTRGRGAATPPGGLLVD